jgi:hypothetical protein
VRVRASESTQVRSVPLADARDEEAHRLRGRLLRLRSGFDRGDQRDSSKDAMSDFHRDASSRVQNSTLS